MARRAHFLARLPLLAGLVAVACGGGSGDDDPDPPVPPYAQVLDSRVAVAGQFDRTVAAGGRYLLVSASENEANLDGNGDGDLIDRIATVVDLRNDTTLSLGLAIAAPPLSNGDEFAFLVSEQAQNGTDLNGDGDTGDAVWFVFDPARPVGNTNPFNLRIATPALGLSGAAVTAGFLLPQSELAERIDLNGDGDQLDVIANAVVSSGAGLGSTPFPSATIAVSRPLVARGARVLVPVSEPSANGDFNGDGDRLDTVLLLIDFTGGSPQLVPIGQPSPRAVGMRPYALTTNAAVYMIDEASEGGFDFNTDGDNADGVLAVYDVQGFAGEILPTDPAIPSFGLAGDSARGIVVAGDFVLFAIPEAGQGSGDLNGDMDTFDAVPAWVDTGVDPGRAFLHPLALSQQPLRLAGEVAVVAVSETASGAVIGVDLNADGDTSDDVAHLIRLTSAPGVVTNLQLAVASLDAFGRDVLLGVSEPGQNGDLNGDGDAIDRVLTYLDVGPDPALLRPLGLVPTSFSLRRVATNDVRIALVLPENTNPTLNDMTGDGQLDDEGLVLLALDPSFDPPRVIAPTPFVAGAASFLSPPPVAVDDDRFAWPVAESMAAADLNEDGDGDDTVVRYLRVVPTGP